MQLSSIAAISSGVLFSIFFSVSAASCTISVPTTTAPGNEFKQDGNLGQSFISCADGIIKSISLAPYSLNGDGVENSNVTFILYSGDGTHNAPLFSMNLSLTGSTNAGIWETIDTSSEGFAVTSGTTYTFELQNANLHFNNNDSYTDGVLYFNGGVLPSFDLPFEIVIEAPNNAPIVDLNGGDVGQDSLASFTEGSGAVVISPNATVTEFENDPITSISISLTNVRDGASEGLIISAAAQNALTGVSGASDISLQDTILIQSASATRSEVETFLRAISYNNTSVAPNTINRYVDVVINDGIQNSTARRATIDINDVNSEPTIATNTGVTLDEGNAINITSSELAGVDIDGYAYELYFRVITSPANGKLYNTDRAQELRSGDHFTQEDIDNGYLQYTHNGGETTADSFEFELEDDYNASTGTQSFSITVTPVNDLPEMRLKTDNLAFDAAFRDGESGTSHLGGPRGVVVSPDGKFVYVAARYDSAITVFNRDSLAGTLTVNSVYRDGDVGILDLFDVEYIVMSADGTSLYATIEDGFVVFDRNIVTGALTYSKRFKAYDDGNGDGSAFPGLRNISNLNVSPDGKSVYTITANSDNTFNIADFETNGWPTITVFDRNLADGSLQFNQYLKDTENGIDGLRSAESIVVSPDGKSVYVASKDYFGDSMLNTGNALVAFDRDIAGSLTFRAVYRNADIGSTGLVGAHSVTVSPDNKSVYVVSENDDALVVFDRDTTDGALILREIFKDNENGIDGLDKSQFVAVSPNGQTVYVVGRNDNALTIFDRDPTGALSFNKMLQDGQSGINGLGSPRALALSADNQSVYVAANSDDALVVFGPIATLTDFTLNFFKNAVGQHLFTLPIVSDAENDDLTITLALADAAAGELSGSASGSALFVVNNGVATLSGSLADVSASLASLTFTPALNYSGNTSISVDMTDGTDSITTVTISVNVIVDPNAPEMTYGASEITDIAELVGKLYNSIDVTAHVDADYPSRLIFNPDGSRFYLAQDHMVIQYDLAKPFDLDTATYTTSFDAYAQSNSANADIYGIRFNPDGSKMFLGFSDNRVVFEYDLSANYDIATATYNNQSVQLVEAAELTSISFNSDGTKLFATDPLNDTVEEFTLSSPFSLVGSATHVASHGVISTPYSGHFNSDGTRFYTLSAVSENIVQYNLSTAYNFTTATLGNTLTKVAQGNEIGFDTVTAIGDTNLFIVSSDLMTVSVRQYGKPGNSNWIEAAANNGSLTKGVVNVYLSNDELVNKGGMLVEGAHYTLANKPAGLSSSIAVAANGLTGQLTLSGRASVHESANNIANLQITFLDAAFATSNAIQVSNAIAANTGASISFEDGPTPPPVVTPPPPTNNQPVITGAPLTTIEVGQAFSFTPNVNDADSGDALILSVTGLPSWLTFDSVTGQLSGTPARADIGSSAVTITVTDDSGASNDSATLAFSLVVTEKPNNTPVISGTPATSVEVGEAFNFTPNVSDADEADELSFSVNGLPAWASFDESSGTVSGEPSRDDVDTTVTITITVDDNSKANNATASLSFSVLVKEKANAEPVANDDSFTFERVNNDTYSLPVLANDTDIDSDTLTIVAANSSLGVLTVNANNIELQAPANFVGELSLSYSIDDGFDHVVSATANVTITAADGDGPVITVPPTVEVNATGLYTKVNLGTAVAVNRAGKSLPVSLVDGDALYQPGNNIAYWQSTDPDTGTTSTASQKVIVHPLVSLAKDQTVIEGNSATVSIYLNGQSPRYPIEVAVHYAGSADNDDYLTTTERVVIESGVSASFTLDITADDIVEGNETIVVEISGANMEDNSAHTITVAEGNVAPVLVLESSQAGENRSTITPKDGDVTISAQASDINGDDMSYQWSFD